MSRTTTAARRIALLSTSSFGLAAIVSAASLGVAFMPTVALADNECAPVAPAGADPGDNGATADAYECSAATYATGITYDAEGNLTVTKTNTTTTTVTANGVNLTGDGTEALTWNSTAGTVSGGAGTAGPVISVTSSGSGAINVSTAGVTGSSATVTHGIFAESTGGGNVSVTTSGNVSGTNAATGSAAIEARSTGGSGDVNVTLTAGGASGRLYGILAEAAGAGDLTIDMQGSSGASGATALVYAKTGSGLLRIDAGALGGGSPAATGSALRIETGGDAILNFNSISMRGSGAIVDMATSAGTQTTLTVTGNLGALFLGEAFRDETTKSLAIRAAGGGSIAINSGGVGGRVDFSAHTGALDWNVNSVWTTSGASFFGAGDAMLTIGADAVWVTGLDSTTGDPAALEIMMIDFGGGGDRVTNIGEMIVGAKSASGFGRYSAQDNREIELRLSGLETFENAGTIYFGSTSLPGQSTGTDLLPGSYATGPNYLETDYTNDDVLLMPETHWIGSGGRLVMDAFLDQNQSACDVSLRAAGTNSNGSLRGEMPAADCLGLHGGSTEGVTNVLINQLATGDRGGAVRIVLVDVAGGTSEGGHFVLDPLNHGYNPANGGYLDLGYIIMPLVYDAEAQQHVLLGTAGQNAWQTAGWAAAAHDVWRVSTGSWLARQADLRGHLPDGYGGGIWLRTSADFATRDVEHAQVAGTSTFTFDNSYEQSTYAVTGGADLLVGGGADSAWAVGVMAGYANSELAYDASPNTAQFDSWNGGLYASFLSGGLYLDALVSGSKGDVKADMPEVGLLPAGTLLDTNLLTVGAQVEGGWRIPLMESLFIEPLAGVSYVRTKWDEMTIASDDPLRPGVDVEFDDPTSLRANLGARLGLDQDYGDWRAQYSILGRVWNEFEGEHGAILHNTQDDILVGDEFTGQLSEFGVGVSLYGLGEALSAFANFGGKFGDEYQSQNATVGVRINW